METKQIINIAKYISWIVFIGLCINAGGIIISTIADYFSSNNSGLLYNDLDFSILKEFSIRYYLYVISFILFIAFLKAYVWYLVLRLFSKINLD